MIFSVTAVCQTDVRTEAASISFIPDIQSPRATEITTQYLTRGIYDSNNTLQISEHDQIYWNVPQGKNLLETPLSNQ